MYLGRHSPTFRKNVLASSSDLENKPNKQEEINCPSLLVASFAQSSTLKWRQYIPPKRR
jgi:hypothetical protein